MRTYDVAIASLAINAPVRWTDNLLVQHPVEGVVMERRGVARKIPHASLLVLAVVRELHVTLGFSVREAARLAPALLASDGGAVPPSGHLRVVLDRPALERQLAARLRDALETAPAPRRGRPRRLTV